MAILTVQTSLSDLRAEIVSDSGVQAAIGNRLYRVIGPQRGAAPYAVMNLVANSPMLTHDGDARQSRMVLQVDVYAATVHAAIAAADALKAKCVGLSDRQGTTDIQVGVLTDEQTSYEEETELFRARLDFMALMTVSGSLTGAVLLESGDELLLEIGDSLLLE